MLLHVCVHGCVHLYGVSGCVHQSYSNKHGHHSLVKAYLLIEMWTWNSSLARHSGVLAEHFSFQRKLPHPQTLLRSETVWSH